MSAQDATSRLAVGAVVRRGSEIFLVAEAATEPSEASTGAAEAVTEPVWALPGGVVEPGEPVGQALIRKVAAETGLSRFRVGALLWVARYEVGGAIWEAYGFEVEAEFDETDDHLDGGVWVPVTEAIDRLSGMWFPPIREPAVQYLTGRAAVATFWAWPRLDQSPEVVPVPATGPESRPESRPESGQET